MANSIAGASSQLRRQGIVLLRGWFAVDSLTVLKAAAERCFTAVEAENALAERHRFNRYSHSIPLTELLEFGCDDVSELMTPLSAPDSILGLDSLISEALGGGWVCGLDHSWVRKKFAPGFEPAGYRAQGWHQDGALGVLFPAEPGKPPAMTRLVTCWIPFDNCGKDSPGLEFVRGCQPELLHFSELDDASIRLRFGAEEFWAPEIAVGDCLVFANSLLHRSYTLPSMRSHRMSLEYRLFPR